MGIGAASVLAHQGGWDELLLVLAPVAAFAGLLWVANRRADTFAASHPTDTAATPPDAGDQQAE